MYLTWNTQANEADILLSTMEDPGSFAVIVMKTLKGYFLLMRGKEEDVLDAVAKPVVKALEADAGVLNFPLCWNMYVVILLLSCSRSYFLNLTLQCIHLLSGDETGHSTVNSRGVKCFGLSAV